MKIIYVAADGVEFDNEDARDDYEAYFLNIKTIEEAIDTKATYDKLRCSMKKEILPIYHKYYIKVKLQFKELIENKTKYSIYDFNNKLEIAKRRVTNALNDLKDCIKDFRRLKRIIHYLHIKILIFKDELFTMERIDDMYDGEYKEFTYCKVGDKVHCKPYASLNIDMDGTVVNVSNCYVRVYLETPNNSKYANSVIRIPLYYVKDYITVLN